MQRFLILSTESLYPLFDLRLLIVHIRVLGLNYPIITTFIVFIYSIAEIGKQIVEGVTKYVSMFLGIRNAV